jgi:E3 ubiquitin-protein ligase synoviolin
LADSTNMEPSGDQGVVGQPRLQFSIQGGPPNLTLPQLPHCVFVPIQAPGACVYQGERACSTPNSELEAQKNFLQHQIEVSLSALNRLLLLLLLLYNVQRGVNLISNIGKILILHSFRA